MFIFFLPGLSYLHLLQLQKDKQLFKIENIFKKLVRKVSYKVFPPISLSENEYSNCLNETEFRIQSTPIFHFICKSSGKAHVDRYTDGLEGALLGNQHSLL